jgi:pilus assembly protein CpaB
VARFEFFPGEPIREAKLVHTDQGYLSAVLEKGKRGVSIPISAASGSGGFIVPNDRVDVVLTHGTATGDVSETILANVKVLAIGQRLGQVGKTGTNGTDSAATAADGDPKAELFTDQTIATLELDPGQGETLVNAAATGSLSLALRSIADFNESAGSARRPTNQPVRVIRYGQEASIVAGSANLGEGEISPAGLTQPISIRPSVGPTMMAPSTQTFSPPPPPPAEPVQ